MKTIVILLTAFLIYDYFRDRKIEKELAKIKAECIKGSDQNAR